MAFASESITSCLTPFLSARRWVVAYSGGVDSHVLLHLLAKLPQHPPIHAIHINHQLQPQASDWVEHCQQQAAALDIPFTCIDIEVDKHSGQGLEAQARDARYYAFEELLEAGDVLMQGHHRDDQVETFMLRLLRGSGSKGLSAIPQQRTIADAQLFRPLLSMRKRDIEAYARSHRLQWVEDPSNQANDFDRNYLRNKVLPLLEVRWPNYRSTLARAAQFSEQSHQLNQELASIDAESLQLDEQQHAVAIENLQTLSIPRQRNVLRFLFSSWQFSLPNAAQLEAIICQLMPAKGDAIPKVEWFGAEVRRFKNQLYIMRPLVDFDSQQVFPWLIENDLVIDGVGTLCARPGKGPGLDSSKLANKPLTVRFRQGGERCQPAGRSNSQTLKKLLQEYDVKPWLRDRIPLIYCGDMMVAVGDLWVNQEWFADSGAQWEFRLLSSTI